jgi:hypothetical protein
MASGIFVGSSDRCSIRSPASRFGAFIKDGFAGFIHRPVGHDDVGLVFRDEVLVLQDGAFLGTEVLQPFQHLLKHVLREPVLNFQLPLMRRA